MVLLEEGLSMELLGGLGEIGLEEGVYLGLGLDFLVVREVVGCGKLAGVELN